MVKRVTSSISPRLSPKKARTGQGFNPIKFASKEAADAVSADPPPFKLLRAVEHASKNPHQGDCVVYWMRMADLRICDNRALSRASAQAQKIQVPIIVLYTLSPQDYIAHDTSARRVDFVLRNLSILKQSLNDLNIPLHTTVHSPRRTLPSHVVSFLHSVNASHLFSNIEYELDELRRDTEICELAEKHSINTVFVHNKCIVEPGVCKTQNGGPYTVFSPYQRNWSRTVNSNLAHYLEDCPKPLSNADSIRKHKVLGPLFNTPIPESISGFELDDVEKARMAEVWPAGEDAAQKILERFLHTKSRVGQMGPVDPLIDGAEKSDKKSRIMDYKNGRDKVNQDSTSRLSPYLAAGVISVRHCVRKIIEPSGKSEVKTDRDSGVGVWVQELAWRDFYTEILAQFPRVSMGRPFKEKYAAVKWEVDDENLQAWKDGKTGYPIVDAAMRQLKTMGWMHNRLRMIVAMFLTKDLMMDWRIGERYFMEQLIDGDQASNNGGWQWAAGTGTDAAPYFRIFNPYTQSEKADPTGDFIRYYVKELASLRGPELHKPSQKIADKLGYPRPIVKHDEVRERAIRRYQNPGSE